MQPKKYDSFSPKRATSIDGFFVKPVERRPRQPVFHTPTANPQRQPAKLADMPKRPSPQPILASASGAVPLSHEGPAAIPLEGRDRRRRRGAVNEGSEKVKNPRSWKRIAKRSGLILGAVVLAAGLWFGFKFYKDIAKLTGNKNPLSLLGVFKPVPLKNDNGRVNILVAGNSADDAGHNGGNLTDSIMVLSVNTKNNTAMMLSIPRDLWVKVPGDGYSKINAAYPNGGMDLLQQVVEDKLGLQIHYQALVNYSAFRDLVNALGSISIKIESDDPRGIYDPSLDYTSRKCCALAKYPNGPVTLNGKQALNLARARGDAYGSYGYAQSDFTRTLYQRKMLVAIKDKSSQSSVIANPFKVSGLVDAVGNNIKTNLQVNEIETLYTYMKKIDDAKIDSYNINTLKGNNTTMLQNYTAPDGQSALIPAAGVDNYSDIQTQIKKLFTADPVTKEGAVVVVLNATDTAGLAGKQESKLTAKGMDVSLGDASANQATTTIVDNSEGKMPNTLSYLKQQYKATAIVDQTLTRNYPSADFILILGQSAVPPTSSSGSSSTAH
jgi:polyisoprenyl-teichoic acid--peptidoglycan teichoic acid transferase